MPRRKKAVVESSDVESDTLHSPETPKKRTTGGIEAAFAKAQSRGSLVETQQPQSAKKVLNARQIPTRSKKPASKPTSATNSPVKTKTAKNKQILSFFNNATQRQAARVSRSPEKAAPPSFDIADDVINDSTEDDELEPSASVSERGLKRKRPIENELVSSSSAQRAQKFLRLTPTPSTSFGRPGTVNKKPDQRPWTEQYGPVNLDELAVHKRKVQDLRDWLSSVIAGNSRKRLLVIKGAAGTGKTTALKLLSQDIGLLMTEWHNPESVTSLGARESLATQFDEFVARTSTFGSLSFLETANDARDYTINERKQFILLEEFPNTYSQASTVLHGFRNAVLQFLTATTPSEDFFNRSSKDVSIVPVVMIVSESLLTTSTASADSFTVHRLLGTEILNHAGTTVIEFNTIAPTFMSKALDLVLTKEARRSGRRFAPGTAVLKHLSDIGDIRSAVSALEFFCLHQGGESDWSGKIQFTKVKKKTGQSELTSMEKQSLELITQRENTLGIFHAVGKVVYNKREAPAATDTPPPQPGAWLPQHQRDKISMVNVDTLLNELGTDIHVFMLALHENYVLSCQGLETEDTLDSMSGCLESISDADLLCPDRFATNQSRFAFAGTTIDALRQDEISFDTCVRGLLFYLPHPVKRAAPPMDYAAGRGKQGRGSTGFQMLYPTSLRLWRKKEQIEGLVELFNDKFRKNQLEKDFKARSIHTDAAGSVLSWRKQAWPDNSVTASEGLSDAGQSSSSFLRGASKSELLLERLPYVVKIERHKNHAVRTSLSRQLTRVVTFGGLTSMLVDNAGEESDYEERSVQDGAEWSTDMPIEQSPRKNRGPGVVVVHAKEKEDINDEVDKLVLSDDDIEDD